MSKVRSRVKYNIRFSEDWVLLLIFFLLIGLCFMAISSSHVWIAILALLFAVQIGFMLRKQMRSRWCCKCQLAMQRQPKRNKDYEHLYYVCPSCGETKDSGLQLTWPE